LGVLLLLGLLAPLIAPYDPNTLDLLHRLAPPTWPHPLGTATFVRDIFSRVLHALRPDLQVTVVITFVPLLVGVLVGALPASSGRTSCTPPRTSCSTCSSWRACPTSGSASSRRPPSSG